MRGHGDRLRLDLHNASVNILAAEVGLCGFTHLATGRVCLEPHHHEGPCELVETFRAPAPAQPVR